MLALQFVLNGIVAGAVYALMAAGFALVYNSTRIFHVVHGSLFSLGGYAFFVGAALLALPWPLAAALAIGVAALGGVLVELMLYRPLRGLGVGLGTLLIASLGAFIVLQNLFTMIFSNQTQIIRRGSLPAFELGGLRLTTLNLAVIVIAVLVFSLLQLFLTRTETGKALRALADNPDLATVIGLDTRRLYALIFAIGSALAGLAAVLVALDVGVRPELGLTVVLIAIIAVIIGGVGHLLGAAIAALLLGIAQNLTVWQISAAWQDTVVFAVLILFLILRPQGLFGATLATRRS